MSNMGRLSEFIEALKCLIKTSDVEQFAINLTYQDIKEIIADRTLEAIRIINEKNVMIYALKALDSLDDYNSLVSTSEQLTPEEFTLLKEIFKNDQ